MGSRELDGGEKGALEAAAAPYRIVWFDGFAARARIAKRTFPPGTISNGYIPTAHSRGRSNASFHRRLREAPRISSA